MRPFITTLLVSALALFFVSPAATTKGVSEEVLYSFDNNTGDGLGPLDAVFERRGTLYGKLRGAVPTRLAPFLPSIGRPVRRRGSTLLETTAATVTRRKLV
jgi:hypothetical protein